MTVAKLIEELQSRSMAAEVFVREEPGGGPIPVLEIEDDGNEVVVVGDNCAT